MIEKSPHLGKPQKKLRIVDLSYYFAEDLCNYKNLIERYASGSDHLPILAKELDLIVIRHLDQVASVHLNEIKYHFFKGKHSKYWLPFRLHFFVNQLKPDVILLHGFNNPLQALLLAFQTKAKIIIQDHGGGVPSGLTGLFHSWLKYLVKDYFFTAKEQADAYIQRGLISRKSNIHEIMEGSTHLQRINKSLARKNLGFEENKTIFLWVGRLDENKDPLTVLQGFELFLKVKTNCSLYMIYAENTLEAEVTELIKNSSLLKKAVIMLGEIPHSELNLYYSSADYFILGSHYEGSGFALCESLACGCIPVVTDIPSFDKMTDHGNLGALWQRGNKNSLLEALEKTRYFDIEVESLKSVQFFDKELSFEAIANKQAKAIQSVVLRK